MSSGAQGGVADAEPTTRSDSGGITFSVSYQALAPAVHPEEHTQGREHTQSGGWGESVSSGLGASGFGWRGLWGQEAVASGLGGGLGVVWGASSSGLG